MERTRRSVAREGQKEKARRAIERALTANPYDIRSLANAGLIASETGDRAAARAMLARIRAISPLGRSREEVALMNAIDDIEQP